MGATYGVGLLDIPMIFEYNRNEAIFSIIKSKSGRNIAYLSFIILTMTKKEILWREILHQAAQNKKLEFTQKELAEKFGISTSTVFNALKIPRESGAVEVSGRNFIVRDTEKFLYLWATKRNVSRETIYGTHFAAGPKEIEGVMPAEAIFVHIVLS